MVHVSDLDPCMNVQIVTSYLYHLLEGTPCYWCIRNDYSNSD